MNRCTKKIWISTLWKLLRSFKLFSAPTNGDKFDALKSTITRIYTTCQSCCTWHMLVKQRARNQGGNPQKISWECRARQRPSDARVSIYVPTVAFAAVILALAIYWTLQALPYLLFTVNESNYHHEKLNWKFLPSGFPVASNLSNLLSFTFSSLSTNCCHNRAKEPGQPIIYPHFGRRH